MRFLKAKLVISIAIFMPVVIITMIYSVGFYNLGLYRSLAQGNFID